MIANEELVTEMRTGGQLLQIKVTSHGVERIWTKCVTNGRRVLSSEMNPMASPNEIDTEKGSTMHTPALIPKSPRKSRREEVTSSDVPLLICQAREGDSARLGELLDLFRNYLAVLASTQIDPRISRRVSPSDVIQETMMKAHRAFGDFRGISERELLMWLRQILVNNLATLVEQHLIAAKRDVRREVSIDRLRASLEHSTVLLAALLPANASTPSATVQKREEAVLLADRIASLPEDYGQVLMLRNLQEQSFSEVARAMNRSEGAVRMLWLRAIEKLREAYRKERNDV